MGKVVVGIMHDAPTCDFFFISLKEWMHRHDVYIKRCRLHLLLPHLYAHNRQGKRDHRLTNVCFRAVLLSAPGGWTTPYQFPRGDTVIRLGEVEKEMGVLYEKMRCVTCRDLKRWHDELPWWFFP